MNICIYTYMYTICILHIYIYIHTHTHAHILIDIYICIGVTAETLASLSGLIRGRNKIILDITNAQAHIFYTHTQKLSSCGFT